MTRTLTGLTIAAVLILAPQNASAINVVTYGNEPIDVSRYPKGAGAIINRHERVELWSHGGCEGEIHAEGRGNVKVINEILADFGKIDVKTRRVIVHDGRGSSLRLSGDDGKSKLRKAEAHSDWAFSVWEPEGWERFRKQPRWWLMCPIEDTDPPSQIHIYSANIRWADVIVPEGIEVIDWRLEPHGFTTADGDVFEGHVKDLRTGKPIVATARVQRIDIDLPKGKNVDTNFVYTNVDSAKSNADGKWVIKNLKRGPGGRGIGGGGGPVRVVLEADGYAPRVVGIAFVGQPQRHPYDSGLMRSVTISGRVTDEAGKPLPDVDVRLDQVYVDTSGREYRLPTGYEIKSDSEGRFHYDQVPTGEAKVWLRKSGHCLPGLGQKVKIPGDEIELRMIKSGTVRVKVEDFNGGKWSNRYEVKLEPEGGNDVGRYSGSENIGDQNTATFEDVPPGKYVVKLHPNVHLKKQISEPVAIDLKGSSVEEATIKVK